MRGASTPSPRGRGNRPPGGRAGGDNGGHTLLGAAVVVARDPAVPASRPDAPAWAEVAAVATLYVGLTFWWLWPLPRLAATHAQVAPDVYLLLWILAWGSHALATQPWTLFDANAFHPAPHALAFSEHLLGQQPIFAPVYWATGNAVLAANVLVLVGYPLTALAMYALARRWVGGPAAAVAGVLYAFSRERYIMSPHFHALAVWYLPLAILLTDRWLEAARRHDALALGAVLALQALSSIYLAWALALVWVTALAGSLWTWCATLDRRRLAGLALAGGGALAVFALASVPYAELRRLGTVAEYTDEFAYLGVASMATPAVRRYLGGDGVGPIGIALALVALVPPWRGPRAPRVVALVLVGLGLFAAIGPGLHLGGRVLWSPYRLLLDWLPGLSSVRGTARLLAVTHLGLALLAGIGLGRLLGRLRPARAWGAAAIVVVAVLLGFGTPRTLPLKPQPVGDAVPPVYRWLAAHGEGRPLLELPARGFVRLARRMLLSSVHWLPMLGGYTGHTPPHDAYLRALAQGLPGEDALQELVDTVDVGWVLVHRSELPAARAAAWSRPLPAGLEPAGTWGGDLLLRVTRPVREDRRARLRGGRETPWGTPLAPLAGRCDGTLELRRAPSAPWTPLALARVVLTARNLGPGAWPAVALDARHLVRLHLDLRAADGTAVRRQAVALPRDVAPGDAVELAARLAVPAAAGDYVLTAELVQVGDGPLVRCGGPVLRLPLRVEPRV